MSEEPFFPTDQVEDIKVITLMRIYDVLISIFMMDHEAEASKLVELHKAGGLLIPDPFIDPAEIRR